MENQFGRKEVRAVLERDAERSLRYGAPLFAVLHLCEALSHSAEGLSLTVLLPLTSSFLLAGLTLYQRKSPEPFPHISFWILVPWALSIGSIVLHVPIHPQVALAFVTLALMTSATLLLPSESFGVALAGSLFAQVASLAAISEIDLSGLVMVPAFSFAIALLVYASRRRGLISAERARFFERELNQKQAELAVLQHKQESARLESALQQQSDALQESRRSLEEQRDLAALGTVAAGVAHQVNNPVGAILVAADFALMSADEPAVQTEALQRIRGQAIRCGKIVRSLLKLSKGASTHRESGELVGCVESAIDSVQEGLVSGDGEVQLHVHPGATGLCVFVNLTELVEVFVNLIQNGLDSKSFGARVRVDVAPADADGIHICVRDNGPGVEPLDTERIFEPFFSNRVRQGGTGLGLSLAKRIIADSGGRIGYQSKGKGSFFAEDSAYAGAEFYVWLPVENKE